MAKKTIVVCGHGPGISDAVARKFGREGFDVALVARNAERVGRAAEALATQGISARGFGCDLGDLAAVAKTIAQVRAELGPITVLHWNAYTRVEGDLLDGDLAAVRHALDVSVIGLIAAARASLGDLREQKDSAAILVTGGGFGVDDPRVNGMAAQWGAMDLALQKGSQHKLTGLLHAKLAAEGIYVGEVVVQGMVKGTAFDRGNATLESSAIADRFFEIYRARKEISVVVAG
jgi:NAD(P)-dependent dehydrogenase (short-subunit alcohol dehydrogenase family)